MADFAPSRVAIDAAQRKRVKYEAKIGFAVAKGVRPRIVYRLPTDRKRGKYMTKCAAIGYGFLPFSFSSLGGLEADAVTLLKRIRKFSMAQDIGARAAVHIFNRISFAIAKGYAFDVFNATTNASAPHMMKTMAKCYFGVIEKDLIPGYSLSPRQVVILSCIRSPHAQDFLFTIPVDGLGQRMNHRQFRSVLCYRLVIPMYNLVRDILVDICSKVGIMVGKEAPIGFLSEDENDLRPADLLLFNWSQGKDACLDVTDISPFAGMRVNSWAPNVRTTDTSSSHLLFQRLRNLIRML
ncbi:hypothetical protein Tco_0890063 [Tanacetum coccineum]